MGVLFFLYILALIESVAWGQPTGTAREREREREKRHKSG